MWIDLNVPYYHTSESNHYDRKGGRRIAPEKLDAVLYDVATRRCASCHQDGVAVGYCDRHDIESKKAKRCASCHEQNLPRKFYTRILQPENNNFLLAPLAKSAGGTEACGKPVFESREDPDYQAILATFKPINELLENRPRMDMTTAPCECARTMETEE